ncbi:MAG: DUF423 domain-containing protein, partial [Flavobacteriales bacterium]
MHIGVFLGEDKKCPMTLKLKKSILFAIGLMFSGIFLGALGAHSLKSVLSPDKLLSFKTAVNYQFIGAFGVFIQALISHLFLDPNSKWAWVLMQKIGVVLFSGSIYLLVFLPSGLLKSFLGPVT